MQITWYTIDKEPPPPVLANIFCDLCVAFLVCESLCAPDNPPPVLPTIFCDLYVCSIYCTCITLYTIDKEPPPPVLPNIFCDLCVVFLVYESLGALDKAPPLSSIAQHFL